MSFVKFDLWILRMEFNSFTAKPPHLGKTTIKEATQANAHSLKLHFVCLKYHKLNIKIWIVIKVFAIFSINCKVYMFKA